MSTSVRRVPDAVIGAAAGVMGVVAASALFYPLAHVVDGPGEVGLAVSVAVAIAGGLFFLGLPAALIGSVLGRRLASRRLTPAVALVIVSACTALAVTVSLALGGHDDPQGVAAVAAPCGAVAGIVGVAAFEGLRRVASRRGAPAA